MKTFIPTALITAATVASAFAAGEINVSSGISAAGRPLLRTESMLWHW
ncbi:hypothetical protein [Phaeobacter porticola]|uniref:Uncharacterized protein n=1 Tax=Phaeobacter porticola TaxID=1844006 RepID=A0A1L3I838_9RHOB|nr:hypothetical protein [Phaeobacter porticola]APG48247.1 hypothetical protein PhaeoP97_02871 [Phaeobacter porticola]